VPLPPLPHEPDFPVYGLDASFTGARWLDLWNPVGPKSPASQTWVTDITLGHGSWDRSGAIVLVHSMKRGLDVFAGVQRARPGHDVELEHVLANACVAMLHLTAPDDADAQFWREGATRMVEMAESPDDLAWSDRNLAVDGAMATFKAAREADVWVAGAVRDHSVIGVVVRGFEPEQIRLEKSDLSRYQPLRLDD
jgi:hypothetical protein